jgi:hypothetical protein
MQKGVDSKLIEREPYMALLDRDKMKKLLSNIHEGVEAKILSL